MRTASVFAVAIVPPLLLGGALGWTVSAISTLAMIALGGTLASAPVLPRIQPIDRVAIGVCGWTAFQLLPFPSNVIEFFSPERADALVTRSIAGVSATWMPLSLDPGRTLEALLVGSGVIAAYVLGRISAHNDGRRLVIVAVVTSASLMTMIGFAHELANAHRVFGFYDPLFAVPRLMTPLLNANHLGAFLAFGSTLALGLGLATDGRTRALSLLGAVLCGSGAVAALSRGAVMSIVLGVGGAMVVHRKDTSRVVGIAIAGMSLVFGLVAYFLLDGLTDEFDDGFDKVGLALKAGSMILSFPIVGIGRKAFAPVYARVEDATGWAMTPENFLVSWSLEWGVVCCGVLVVAIAGVLRTGWQSHRSEVRVACVALLALATHDLFDYALEMPGILCPVALVFGAVATRPTPTPVPKITTRRLKTRVAYVFALTATLALAAAIPRIRPENLADRLRAHDASSRLEAVVAVLHPFDPSLALWVGWSLSKRGDGRALVWLNRAMQLAPGWSSPHAQTADILFRLDATRQALLEVREAETRLAGSAFQLTCRSAAHTPSLIVELASDGVYLDRVSTCLDSQSRALLDDVAAREGRATVRMHARRARRFLRTSKFEAARHEAAAALRQDPDSELAALTQAEIAWRSQRPDEASRIVRELPTTPAVVRFRARLAVATNDSAALENHIAVLNRNAAGDAEQLAGVQQFLGRLHEQHGNYGAALEAYNRASRLNHRNYEHLHAVARVAGKAGWHGRARRAHHELCEAGELDSCRLLESRLPARQRTARPQ